MSTESTSCTVHINFGGENNPFEIQKLIDSLHGNPLEDFVSNSIIRCFAKAKYQPENIGHFGLGSKAYAHSTAPIRRFPDTLVQHIVSKWIDKENCIMDFDLLQALGVHSSEQERKAQDAETLSDSLLSAIWAEGQLGKKMEGFVTGVSSSSIFVQLKDKLVTVEIPVIELEGKDRARYCTNPLKTKISCVDGKEFKLGQSVALVMYNADRAEKKIFASLNLDRKIEKPLGAVAKTEVCEPKRQIDKKKKQNRNSEYSL
ncbi:MAG: RNB domain-containing ribonuclease [Clostridia bacterium]